MKRTVNLIVGLLACYLLVILPCAFLWGKHEDDTVALVAIVGFMAVYLVVFAGGRVAEKSVHRMRKSSLPNQRRHVLLWNPLDESLTMEPPQLLHYLLVSGGSTEYELQSALTKTLESRVQEALSRLAAEDLIMCSMEEDGNVPHKYVVTPKGRTQLRAREIELPPYGELASLLGEYYRDCALTLGKLTDAMVLRGNLLKGEGQQELGSQYIQYATPTRKSRLSVVPMTIRDSGGP